MNFHIDIDISYVNNSEVLNILKDLDGTKTVDDLGLVLSKIVKIKKKLVTKKPKLILNSNFNKQYEDDVVIDDCMDPQVPQIFVQDIQKLILSALLHTHYRYLPQWCKILRCNNVNSVVLITINDYFDNDYLKDKAKFEKLFAKMKNDVHSIEFVSSSANNSNFFNEFISVPMLSTQWMSIRDSKSSQVKQMEVVERYKRLFKENKNKECTTFELDKISRVSILLNVEQLVKEDYPLWFDEKAHDLTGYVYSKVTYAHVTNKSPLYAIDCEMCYNIDGDLEVVWIAIVNEQLQCIYETYVKPMKKVANYLTRITGVDENTLKSINTKLCEVQEKLQSLLPSDAILCGHSLNNDLHALKLYHPYVIDTSVVYNLTGSRDFKPSLRKLAAQFLGRIIQEGQHNPVIDAKVTMQLVLLKLRQGLDFGDVIINGSVDVYNNMQLNMDLDIDMSKPDKIASYIYKTGLNINQTTFDVLDFYKVQNAFIDQFDKKMDNSTIVKDNDEALSVLMDKINDQLKFVWCQLYAEKVEDNEVSGFDVSKILKKIRKIYRAMSDDSFLIILLAGGSNGLVQSNHHKNLHKGRCFIKHKNDEIDALNKLIRDISSKKNSIK